ncbi:MAG: hypothetical protein OSB73_20505, partial [Candidatus Latescibacteria bacterium]|nr:hypothetical protein [Candidatus Latescibacterota bacterium]
DNTMNRFWHHAVTTKEGDAWKAEMPVSSADKSLWVYANVVYPLDEPVTGAGYYYRTYTATTFNLSSLVHLVSAEELQAAGVTARLKPSPLIETFASGWEKEWFTYRPVDWARTTHKVYDPQWAAPQGAKLALEVRCEQSNKLVVRLDEFATDVSLKGGLKWQNVVLSAADFRNAADEALGNWTEIKTLRLSAREHLQQIVNEEQMVGQFGAEWKGADPEFRNLQWKS